MSASAYHKRLRAARLRLSHVDSHFRVYLAVYDQGAQWQNFGECWIDDASDEAEREGRRIARQAEGAVDERLRVLPIDVSRSAFDHLLEGDFDENVSECSTIGGLPNVTPASGYRRLWFVTYKIDGRWQLDAEWFASDGGRGGLGDACLSACQQAEENANLFGWAFFIAPVDVPMRLFADEKRKVANHG